MLRRDRVGDEEPDQLDSDKPARVADTVENLSDRVGGKRDETVGGGLRIVRPPGEERDLRTAVAVRRADGAGELDATARTSASS